MRKIYLSGVFTLFLLCHGFWLWGQASEQAVQFRRGAIELLRDTTDFRTDRAAYEGSLYQGRYQVLLQWTQLPDSSQQAELAAAGIKLLDYLPPRTYLASVPGDLSPARLAAWPIRAVEPLAARWKLDPRLDHELPPWAEPEPGVAAVIVHFYAHLPYKATRDSLMYHTGGTFLMTDQYEPGTQLSGRIDADRLEWLAGLPYVAFVAPVAPPATLEASPHVAQLRASGLPAGLVGNQLLSGAGIQVAIGDDGVVGPHIDFAGRLASVNTTTDGGDHGDHVAGILAGAGNFAPRWRGLAPGADLHIWRSWMVYQFPQAYTQDDIWLTSHSLGNGCNTGYNSLARTVDQQSRTLPALLHVFSAGNSGGGSCGGLTGGWRTLTGGIKSGKNVLAVGSLNDRDQLSSYSSKGPATDGRIKPDLVAPGENIRATGPNHSYNLKSGTSMAAPAVTGVLAQLYESYQLLHGGATPDGALIKALLLNTAEDLGNPGPDFQHGWGRVNARRANDLLRAGRFVQGSVTQGNSQTFPITVPSGVHKLRVMLYWHDHEGALLAANALVNDLELRLVDPQFTWHEPWKLDPGTNPTPASCDAPAIRGADHLNNVEQVELLNPQAGNYAMVVTGDQVPMWLQEFVVVYDWEMKGVELTYPRGAEAWVPGETEYLRWDSRGFSGTLTLAMSTNGSNSWQQLGTVNASNSRFSFTVPNNASSLRFRLSGSGIAPFTQPQPTTVLGVPDDFQADDLCPGAAQLSWEAVPGAGSYEVLKLGEKYFEPVANTSGTTFQLQGLDQEEATWLAVRAISPQGKPGRHSEPVDYVADGSGQCPFAASGISQVLSPGGDPCQVVVPAVSVRLFNYGPVDLTQVPVYYQLKGGPVVQEWVPNLPTGGEVDYSFQTLPGLSGPGDYELDVWLEGGDSSPADDSVKQYAFAYAPVVQDFPYLTSFEQGSAGWQVAGTNASWALGVPNGSVIDRAAGGDQAWVTNLSGAYNDDEASYLLSPCFDLSGFGQNPVFSFSLRYELENNYDFLAVEYSEDGQSWNQLGSTQTGFNWYNHSSQRFTGDGNREAWRVASCPVPVDDMNDASAVRFRFVMESDFSVNREGVAIDDVHLHASARIYAGQAVAELSMPVNGSGWQAFTHNGQLLAAINPQGQNLGPVGLDVHVHNGAPRHISSKYYHDRSWVLQAQGFSSPVRLRLYYPDSEAWKLFSANNCQGCANVEDLYRMGIPRYSGAFEDDDVTNNADQPSFYLDPATVTVVPQQNGYYVEFSTTGFSEYWLNGGGSLGLPASAFPVEWLSFVAEQVETAVELRWETATEAENAGFFVERRQAGAELFEELAFVPAALNAQAGASYRYLDTGLSPGRWAYRLKQVDLDGSFSYSELREVTFGFGQSVSAHPNPFGQELTLSLFNESELPTTLGLYDLRGQRIAWRDLGRFSGRLDLSWELPADLPAGMYLLQVQAGRLRWQQRLVHE